MQENAIKMKPLIKSTVLMTSVDHYTASSQRRCVSLVMTVNKKRGPKRAYVVLATQRLKKLLRKISKLGI